MTKLQAIRWFANQLTDDSVTIARKRLDRNWGMNLSPWSKTPQLSIPVDLRTNDDMDKQFRRNIVSRCKLTQGFSNVTLAILHEFGHWETRSIFNMIAYRKIANVANNMQEYMENPYERIATEWAICWLQVPQNRQLAKEFEKKYFGYGEK
jgi:hypothetical protein